MRKELSCYFQSSASLLYASELLNDDDMYKMVVQGSMKSRGFVVSTMDLGGQCELTMQNMIREAEYPVDILSGYPEGN